jgi:hypothetical protein
MNPCRLEISNVHRANVALTMHPLIKYLDNGTSVLERTHLSGIDNSDGGRWSDSPFHRDAYA